MDQDHVRPVPAAPRVAGVVQHADERVHLLLRACLGGGPGHEPVVQRRPVHPRSRRRPGERCQPLPVDVVALVVQRHGQVERVPGDHDIGRARVERDPVERGVRLDDPPVLLGLEPAYDVLDGLDRVVEPRREHRQRRRQVRRPEHQQRADHLHPGRAALRPRADHDVAVAEPEVLPAGAVLVGRDVAKRCRAHPGTLATAVPARPRCGKRHSAPAGTPGHPRRPLP